MRESIMLTGDHTPQSHCLCRKCIHTGWGFNLEHDPVEGGCDAEDCECETVILGGVEFYKPSPDNGIELSGAVIITRIHVNSEGLEIPDDGAGWE